MDEPPCDQCKASSDAGHAYCTKCGRPVNTVPVGTQCEQCSVSADAGHAYCIKCGEPLGTEPKAPGPKKQDNGLRKIVGIVGVILLFACTAMLVFELYTVFWAMPDILAGMRNYRLGIMFLVPVPVIPFYISGIVANIYYLFLVVAVVVSFIMIMYGSREGLAELFKGKLDKLDDMPLYGVVTLFAMYISVSLMLVLLVTSVGYDPVVPEDPVEPWMLWYALLNASVWEEVICRVLMIGVPLMIAGIIMKENGSWKRLFGHYEMNKLAVILIIASAAVFAAGHFSGWDLFKVIPTFVSGLALGYLFVRYGLHAAIIFHFLVDYMSAVTWVFGASADGGTPTTAELMLGLFIIAVVVLGIPFIVRYAKRGFAYMKKTFLQ